jgi:hypothetical protein
MDERLRRSRKHASDHQVAAPPARRPPQRAAMPEQSGASR